MADTTYPATDVEQLRTAMNRVRKTDMPRDVPTLPRIDDYAPKQVTEQVVANVAKVLDEDPLVMIAKAILDLRYGKIMQFDAELIGLEKKDEDHKGKYAALLFEWATETTEGKDTPDVIS